MSKTLRKTAAGVVVVPAQPWPLLLVHTHRKAEKDGEHRFTTVGGGIHTDVDETPVKAMERELQEEYGVHSSDVTVSDLDLTIKGSKKVYHWFLVQLPSAVKLQPDPAEVLNIGHFTGYDGLSALLSCMTLEKRGMYTLALLAAAPFMPELRCYTKFLE